MMKIAIVDDEPNILDRIKQCVIGQFDERNLTISIYTYTNGSDLLNDVEKGCLFDVVFLDIELPDGLGLNVSKQLRASYHNIIIAFVTSFDNYVYDAFDYDAIGYIRKHELDTRISVLIDRIIKKYRDISNEKIFKNSTTQCRESTQNIVYFESDNHIITIFFNNGSKFSYTDSLKRLEEEYAVYGFFRIHAGYLVNLNYVYSIEKDYLVLKYAGRNEKLIVSRGKSKELKKAFQQYFRGGL